MFRLLGAVVLAVFVSGQVFAQERALQKLSEHVYAYAGAAPAAPGNSFGANVGVVVGEDGVLVVDTLISAKEAELLKADIAKVTGKPVRYVVNTHFHLDHAWGNAVFEKGGALVIDQENAKAALPKNEYALAHADLFGLTPQDMEGTALAGPVVTFKDNLRVDLGGGVVVDMAYLGPTHTKDSVIVTVPGDKVMFTGDLLFAKCHPYMGEGDIANWEAVLAKLEKSAAGMKVVPGHGPVSTVAAIRAMEEYVKAFDTRAQELCKGKTQDDASAVTAELLKQLPEQGRTELAVMVESNLREKYLAPKVVASEPAKQQ